MDEFDKIRELTEDLTNRREPTFTGFYQTKQPTMPPVEEVVTPLPSQPTELTSEVSSVQQVVSQPEQVSSYELTAGAVLEQPNQEQPKHEDPEIKIYDFSKPIEEEISFIPMDQPDPVEEKSFPSLKLHLIIISILLVILGISLTGFFIFSAHEDESDEIETITASSDPVKELPENVGGIVIPDQDKLVYNRIRSDNVTTKVESLFPEPEKPVLPQILAIEQNAPEAGFVAMEDVKPVDPLQQPVEKIKPVVVQKEEQPSEKPKPAPVVVAAPAVVEVSVPQPKKEVIELAPMGTPLVNKEKKSKTKELWRVQLFASNSKPAVEKAWKRIQVKHAKLLSNMSYLIKKVEIPRKGDFFRLQVGQFPSREMAEGLCSKLRVQKQDCLPVK